MAEIIWQEGPSGLAVSTYAGPVQPASVSRTRVQVTTVDGQFLSLTMTEWADLCSAVRQLAGQFMARGNARESLRPRVATALAGTGNLAPSAGTPPTPRP